MPNTLIGINVAHFTSSFSLLLKKPKLSYSKNIFNYIFFIYLGYLFARLLFYYCLNIDEVIFDDLSELKRVLILAFSYLLARRYNIQNSKYITLLYCLSILSYFFELNIYSEEVRFSAFMPSVNYVWVSVLFLVSKGKNIISNYDTLILAIFGLLLSGSLTSIVVCIIFLLLIFIFSSKVKLRFIPLFSLVLIAITLVLLSNNFFEGFTYHVNKLTSAYRLILEGELLEYRTFQQRLIVWKDVIPMIADRPLVGYGVSKDLLRYTDNQYLMTAFRYGFVGLVLEICLFVSILYRAYKRNHFLYSLFIVGILISGITAHSIYEIKTIPIIGIIIGELFKFDSNEK